MDSAVVCLLFFVPVWTWILNRRHSTFQRTTLQIAGSRVPLGTPRLFLAIAYIAAFSAIQFQSTWYGQWLVFGGIVSPIIEEIFSRHLLSPWLNRSYKVFVGVSVISALAFSLMHWGFGSGNAFSMGAAEQIQKLWGHFSFAIIISLIFRWSRSLPLIIVLHAASNMRFLLTKL